MSKVLISPPPPRLSGSVQPSSYVRRTNVLETEIQLWQCWQAGALTYLVMILRSRLISILATAPPATKLCNRDVQISLGLRKRYLMWIFPPVSIAHHHCRRRCVCDSEEQRFLSRLLWFSWHPWQEPCSDRAVTTSHSQAARYISGEISLPAKTPNLWVVLLLTLRLSNDVFLAGDSPCVPLCVTAVASV